MMKSSKFNSWIESNITPETAARDAKEFIDSCAIIDKEKVVLNHEGIDRRMDLCFCQALCVQQGHVRQVFEGLQ